MSKNTLNILVVSASSLSLARKIRDEYPGKTVIYCREADNDIEPVTSFKELTGNLFDKSETIVFIGAMGICVRSIAPYIKSKYTDPAVICLDSTGKYVVSVLSGHIGGANELTHELARILDAEAVVTTQSDNQGLWALDTFAKQYGWEQDVYNPQEGIISFFQTDFEKIDEETFNASREKAMNECVARFVNCRPTALLLDIRTKETDYMKETCPPHVDVFYKYKDIDLEKYELLITVSPTYYHKSPIPCLSFFPKVLHLGIGCKKGLTDMKSVLTDLYICSIFYRFNLKSIANVSSIDLKKEEPILKELADTYLRSPFKTYPAEVLDKVPVPHPSSTVKKATGSGSVAEAAAILSAEGGPLLVGKQKGQTKDFTYAIAISKSAIQDEEDSQQKGKQGHGHIEIVGAGPGDPELISIRGRRMLENADLILYAGSLVPKELTLCAKKGSTIRSSADMNLEEQFALIKKFYDKGKFIVRLHTGDPCIYGAIQEQMAFFDRYGMSYPFKTYPAEVLDKVPVPHPSSTVKKATGSGSVAEAAAILSAEGGPLLVGKQKGQTKDFTYAIAISKSAIQDEEDSQQKGKQGHGHIEIVGAGPGDPELISIRGRRMLENADLILYAGSLVPKELTLCAKKGSTIRSSADMNLEEQFALIKKFYDKGKFIVRLHTGDPCIYGAIQEQMAFFDRYGMSYHITPGISSFQAAAAALRSQFTIPEKVQTIILTRGEGRTPMPEKEQLHKLAASQSTMCIFLSAGIAGQVQKELLEHYPPTTPVAACYKLTWKDERIYRGELKDLEQIVKENNLTLTTLLVVGDAIDNRTGVSRLYAEEFKHLYRR